MSKNKFKSTLAKNNKKNQNLQSGTARVDNSKVDENIKNLSIIIN